jgi:hypothetical protein
MVMDPDHVSDFDIAVSSLAAMSLMAQPGTQKEKSNEAVRLATKYVVRTTQKLKLPKDIKSVRYGLYWSCAYGVIFLSKIHHKTKDQEVRDALEMLADIIGKLQLKEGGWSYQREASKDKPISFLTAIMIQAIIELKSCEITFDQEMFKRAVEVLKGERKSDGTFAYTWGKHQSDPGSPWEAPHKDKVKSDAVGDSPGRTVLGELTLFLINESSAERLQKACELFVQHRDRLEEAWKKKAATHTYPYGVAVYYYSFSHYNASQAVQKLSKDSRQSMSSQLHKVILQGQDKEGNWPEEGMYGSKSYTTAIALLILAQVP